ncbi:MAG TPA: DinB family protein [Methylomirabilota bacterium]|nr:DinB family protein [Methylomirabilota bacterium]
MVGSARCPICRSPHARLGRRAPLDALRAFPRALAAAVLRAPRGRLARRPRPREWSVTEVLGHLLDAEVTLGFRVRKAAAEPRSAMVAWDQEKWTHGLRHRGADARLTLAAFAALRAANVALARRLSPAQRRLGGRHPEYGTLRVEQMLAHFAEHDLDHLEQIRRALRAGA